MTTDKNYGEESTPTIALAVSYGEDSLQSFIVHGDLVEETPIEKLTKEEKETLRKLEDEIERDLVVYCSVAGCLLKIKTEKLYRGTHKSFESYCQDKWKMTRVHANRLINFEKCAKNLKSKPIGSVAVPTNESQARVIADLDEEKQMAVASKVKEQFGEKATAANWKSAKEEVLPDKAAKTKAKKAPTIEMNIVPLPKQDVILAPAVDQWARWAEIMEEAKAMTEERIDHEKILPYIEEAMAIGDALQKAYQIKEAA